MYLNEDLNLLMKVLPDFVRVHLENHSNCFNLIEVILDFGKRPEARFRDFSEYLSEKTISWKDLNFSTKQLGNFNDHNRAGIEKTLHRISCIRNKNGNIIGLTCRVGRALFGTVSRIRDLLESGHAILILGRPGGGKTTIIREIARILSDELQKRVIVIDKSNEIGGENDIPHLCIGRARRMQVSRSELQYTIMIEAVENHMPEVVIVDEIGNDLEVLAAKTIAERGIQLIATTHGNSLENLIKNPILIEIIGGIQNVILSDEEAKRRGTQKNILEQKSSATFQILIEIDQKEKWLVHENINKSIDCLLQKQLPFVQLRSIKEKNKVIINQKILKHYQLEDNSNKNFFLKSKPNYSFEELLKNSKVKIYIYYYSVSLNKVQQVFKYFNFNPSFTHDIYKANLILTSHFYFKENEELRHIAKIKQIPIVFLKKSFYT